MLIDKIFAHKRIDLYMEGVRFLDLKRLAKAFDRSKASNFTILLNYQGLGGGKNAYTVGLNRNTGNLAKEIPTTADDAGSSSSPTKNSRGTSSARTTPSRIRS